MILTARAFVLSAIGAQCGRTWLARGKWSCIKNTIRFWSKDDRQQHGVLVHRNRRPRLLAATWALQSNRSSLRVTQNGRIS